MHTKLASLILTALSGLIGCVIVYVFVTRIRLHVIFYFLILVAAFMLARTLIQPSVVMLEDIFTRPIVKRKAGRATKDSFDYSVCPALIRETNNDDESLIGSNFNMFERQLQDKKKSVSPASGPLSPSRTDDTCGSMQKNGGRFWRY